MFGTGSYGRNDQGDATADAAVLSKHLGRPVRVQYMRHEGIAWDPKGTASVNRSKVGLDATGKIIAYENISKAFSRLDVATNEGRAADVLAGHLLGFPLKPDQKLRDSCCVLHLRPQAARLGDHPPADGSRLANAHDASARSFGPPILFGSESFMDEVAAATDTDPVEFRLRYLTHPRDREAVRIAAEHFGWDKRPSPRNDQKDTDVAVGRGIAYRRHFDTFIALVAEVRVHRRTGVIDLPLCLRARCRADRQSRNAAARHRPPTRLWHQPDHVRGIRFDENMVTSVDWVTYPVLHMRLPLPSIDIELVDARKQPPRAPPKWHSASCRPRSATPCSMRPACGCAACPSRPNASRRH